MDHPVCLATPAYLPSGGNSLTHLPFTMWLVDVLRPRVLVELGTRDGAVLCASCETVARRGMTARCHGLVLRETDASAPPCGLAALRAHHDPLYGHFSRLSEAAHAEAASAFADGGVDLLHIDASHPGIRLGDALACWLPKLSRSGVVLVHGTEADGMPGYNREAWAAVRERHPVFQFAHGDGLGVLCVGGEAPAAASRLAGLADDEADTLRLAFFTLGARLAAQRRADELKCALAHSTAQHQALAERLQDATDAQEDLEGEARALRVQAHDRGSELRGREAAVDRLEEQVQVLSTHLTRAEAVIDRLNTAVTAQGAELSSIHSSVGWTLVQGYWALRARWLPSGTRRGDAYERHRDRVLRSSSALLRKAAGRPARLPVQPLAQRLAAPQAARPWEQALTSDSHAHLGRRVLVVAELSMPACKRYRVDQKAAMLERAGIDTTVLDWRDDAACRNALQFHGLVIFYRVPAFPEARRLAREARRLGIASFFDVDDLIFEVDEYRRSLEALGLPRHEREQALDGARLYREMLGLCHHGIGSTPMIARQMRAHVTGGVHVLENGLDEPILRLAEEAARRPRPAADIADSADSVTIGYGSGSRTHDADFALVAAALAAVMKRHAHVRLVVHGLLALPASLAPHAQRIFQVPLLDAEDYLRAVAGWDINIAPLENTAFNQAKSNIKFIEAAAFRVPSVCSPTQPFSAVVEHGKNGMLARDPGEWEQALRALVESEPLRRRMGEEAHRTAMERYHPARLAAGPLQPILAHLPARGASGRLKVLAANVLFAPLSFGGATIVAEQLARELAGDGCDVTVFTGLMQPVLAPYQVVRYEALGLPVIAVQLPVGGDAGLEYRNPAMKDIFVQALRAVRPDVVHLHSVQWLSASLAEACVQEGVPYVITLHDAWWLCERQFMVREDQKYCGQQKVDLRTCSKCVADSAGTYRRSFYLRKVLEEAALLLTPSEFQRQLYVANGMAPARVAVNKNGVLLPARTQTQTRAQWQGRPARPAGAPVRFAYLGGRAAHKGYFWLKDILEAMPESGYVLRITDIALRMGPPSMHAGEWRVPGRVEVVPPYEQSGMDDFFDGVDVLLIPSQWKESFGLAAREALARGVRVIATASGGVVEDIVDGVNGAVVPIGDADAFRDAMREAMADAARGAGERGAAANIRDYRAQARELKGLLLEACRQRAARPQEKVAHLPAIAAPAAATAVAVRWPDRARATADAVPVGTA
jgi:glycosyltransferase involved in cell wall biosynthesis